MTASRTAAAVVEAATKADRRPWVEVEHPRDRAGRFIEIGSLVRLWGSGDEARVVGNLGHDRIEVARTSDGKHYSVSRNFLTVVSRPDGSPPSSRRSESVAAPVSPPGDHTEEHEPEPNAADYDVPPVALPDGPPPDAEQAVADAADAAAGNGEADPTDADVHVETIPTVYEFDAWRLDDAIGRIDTANKRAAKADIADRIGYSIERFTVERPVRDPDGRPIPDVSPYIVDRVRLTLDRPTVQHDGWVFVATLTWEEEGGLVTRVVPDEVLNHRPEAKWCDVCKSSRDRKDTYAVRNAETGEEKQVGSNCLQQFLGIKPSALWMLDWDGGLDDLGGDEDDERGGGWRASSRRNSLEVLAATIAVVRANGWMSRANSRTQGGPATADTVGDVIDGISGYSEDHARFLRAMRADARNHYEEAQAVKDFAAALDGDSEYEQNLRAAAIGDTVSTRNVPLLASAVAAKMRRDEQVARRQAAADTNRTAAEAGHFGTVGEKIKDIDARVVGVRYIEGDYGVTTLLTMVDGDGHVFKWFASGHHDEEIGDEVTIAATIKGHGEFRGVPETQITRAKLTLRGEAAAKAEAAAAKADPNPEGYRRVERLAYRPPDAGEFAGSRMVPDETFEPGQSIRIRADEMDESFDGYENVEIVRASERDVQTGTQQVEVRRADGSLHEITAGLNAVYGIADPSFHKPTADELKPKPRSGGWLGGGDRSQTAQRTDGAYEVGQWVRVWNVDRYVNAQVQSVNEQQGGTYVQSYTLSLPGGGTISANAREVVAYLPPGKEPPTPKAKPKGKQTKARTWWNGEVKTPTWKATEHPRDRHGRFIEVNSWVSMWGGGQGRVTRMLEHGQVEVARSDGKTVRVDQGYITVLRGPDGKAPQTAPEPDAAAAPAAPSATEPGADEPSGAVTPGDPVPVDFAGMGAAMDPAVQGFLVGGLGIASGHPADANMESQQPYATAKNEVTAAITARLTGIPDEALLDPQVIDDLAHSRWAEEVDSEGTIEYHPDPNGDIAPGDERVRENRRRVGVSRLIQRWAMSSNDSDPDTLAMQEIAAEEFGLDDHLGWSADDDLRTEVDQAKAERGDLLRAFLQAQYHETQVRLAAAGITEIPLYRGMRFLHPDEAGEAPPAPDWARHNGTAQVPLRPLSSFSADFGVAQQFADSTHATGVVLSGVVPADRVLSTPRTGVGDLNASEIVLLASPGEWRVTAWQQESDDRTPLNPVASDTPEAAAAPPAATPPPAAITGGDPAPEATPVGAYAYFETPDGGASAWYDDQAGVGYVRTNKDDPSTTTRLDGAAWATEVDDRGMEERDAPTADANPDDLAPGAAAPESMGDFASVPSVHERASQDHVLDGFFDAGLDFGDENDYTGFEADFEEGDSLARARRHDAAPQAKAEVVADLTRRMQHVPDARILSDDDLSQLTSSYWLVNGNSSLGWTPTTVPEHMSEIADAQVEAGSMLPPGHDDVRNAMRAQAVNRLVASWATTSNDGDAESLALQETAADLFGTTDHADWELRDGLDDGIARKRESNGALYEAFLLAQYDATQERFASHGITHVHLYRGHRVRPDALGQDGWMDRIYEGYDDRGYTDIEVPLRPMSSFSADAGIAREFAVRYGQTGAADSVVLEGSVPVERIIGTPRSGVGSLEEAEMVVLHGPGTWRVTRSRDFDPTGESEFERPDGEPTMKPRSTDDWNNTPTGQLLTESDLRAAIAAALSKYGGDIRTANPGRLRTLMERAQTMGLDDLLPEEWTSPDVREMGVEALRMELGKVGVKAERMRDLLAELERREAADADPLTFDPIKTARPLTVDDYEAAGSVPVAEIEDARTYAAAIMNEWTKPAAFGDKARRAALYAMQDRFTVVGASSLPDDWATG